MKKFQKMTAVLLTVTMSAGLLVSGCGNGSGGGDSTGGGSDAGSGSAGAGAGGTEAPSVGAASGNAWDGSLPLTEEKETLTIWMKNDVALMNACGGDPNNSPFFKELEERTNVHIEWQIPASGSESEQFNLLFTSGTLPDIMYYQPPGYIDGLDAAIDDGYILDLTPYLTDNMPNYMAALENASEEAQKMAKTDAGRYGLVVAVYQTEQPPWLGLMLRKDWLDELGLDMPVTVEDWEEMLTAFKEKKGASAPLSTAADFILYLGSGLGVYGGDFAGGWYQVDGKVGYYFYSDPEAGREVLTILNRWYQKGLIDPDFATANAFGDSVLVNNGGTGVFTSMYTMPSTMFAAATEQGAEFVAVDPPVAREGDPLYCRIGNQSYGVQMAVSTDCENPELALRWLDYLYSEEGAMLANYGIEGETYTMTDGTPQYTDVMTSNPDGLSYDDAMRYIQWRRDLSASIRTGRENSGVSRRKRRP